MIELSRRGDVSLVCDVCRRPINDVGLAAVLRGAGGSPVFTHKDACHQRAERFLANGHGWLELAEFVEQLRVVVGDHDQAAEIIHDQNPTRLLRRIAEVAEAAYQRGFQQGHDVCRRGDRLVVDLDAWRFGIPLDKAASPKGDRLTTAVERLDVQQTELVDELLAGAGPRDKQARGHVGRRGSR